MSSSKTKSAFEKIRAGLEDAIGYHKGKRVLTLRDVHLAVPAQMHSKEVVAVRARLRMSAR